MLYSMSATDAYPRLQARRGAGDTEHVIAFRNESLRYCPPIEIVPRKVTEAHCEAAVQLLPDLASPGDDVDLPLGCPCVHRVHHDPSVHPNADQFDPERFLNRTFKSSEFLPFGLGRRFCLGAGVGRLLMDRVLERLLARRLRFRLHASSFRPIRRNVVLWPGAFLFARLRRDHAPLREGQ